MFWCKLYSTSSTWVRDSGVAWWLEVPYGCAGSRWLVVCLVSLVECDVGYLIEEVLRIAVQLCVDRSLVFLSPFAIESNCSTCCAVRVSMSSFRCISMFVMNAMKMSLIRSSSAFPRRHFAPRSLRRQWKLLNFSFSFCLQVNRKKWSYVMLRGRVKKRDSSWANWCCYVINYWVWQALAVDPLAFGSKTEADETPDL